MYADIISVTVFSTFCGICLFVLWSYHTLLISYFSNHANKLECTTIKYKFTESS